MTNEHTLVPELKDWKKENGEKFDLQDWIACEGNIRLAIGYSVIFWPAFIEFNDCVFIKSNFSIDNYEEWTKSDSVENYKQIEGIINHIHILDLFAWEKQEDINYDQVIYLGNILKNIYYLKLRADFPERQIMVTFNDDLKTDDLIDYQLTFYQVENEKRKIKNGS